MNAEDAVLTERHLFIPQAVAGRYAAAARSQGLDFDDLHSAANLAFARALVNWRPDRSPPGRDPLGGWLLSCVEWGVRNVVWLGSRLDRRGEPTRARKRENFWRARLSLDNPMPVGTDGEAVTWHDAACCARPDPGFAAVDDADEIEQALSRLPRRERRVFRLLGAGHNQADVARILGISRERVRQIAQDARARLAGGDDVAAIRRLRRERNEAYRARKREEVTA